LSRTLEDYARRVMSGAARGPRAAALRAATGAASVAYSLGVRMRNELFDAGVRKPARLPRPVVSVGNITTGGTGKTPVVRWLSERLRESGEHVAVLARGYKARPGEPGDEQRMLADLLNRDALPPVIIRANPDRVAAARQVLRDHPETSVFLLDDGFQHRRLARDLDLVLLDAAEPFGYGRVLPRGMLREPLTGLRRAGAFLVTRADAVDASARARLAEVVKRYNPAAPLYACTHAASGFRTAAGTHDMLPPESLRGKSWFAFCGVANPAAFFGQVASISDTQGRARAFPDHHAYTKLDIGELRREAEANGAGVLVTTEKDWARIVPLEPDGALGKLPIWRLDVEVRFSDPADEHRLLEQVKRAIASPPGR
jgi:tetraacyldisaccharide 4'-kinase